MPIVELTAKGESGEFIELHSNEKVSEGVPSRYAAVIENSDQNIFGRVASGFRLSGIAMLWATTVKAVTSVDSRYRT